MWAVCPNSSGPHPTPTFRAIPNVGLSVLLAIDTEFESDLIRARTRDAIAAAAGKMKGRSHTLTPEERAYQLQVNETRQFKIETLCKNTGLKRSALYKNLSPAREERDALAITKGE